MTDASVIPELLEAAGLTARAKKLSPFSLRLTFEERAALEEAAGNFPLGTYIKLKAFDGRPLQLPKQGVRRPVKDPEALAQILALLGRARLANNLNQLAHAANSGSLPVTPETLAAIQEACAEVAAMRRSLLQALGQRSGLEA
jgi:hypothetical protein